jgi:hypothetical protein
VNRIRVFAFLFFVFCLIPGYALGKKDGASKAPDTQRLQVRGRVRLVGSMPLTSLVITDNDRHDWYVEGADRELIRNYEQGTIVVEGRPEYEDMILANGEKLGVRRYLRDIRIIAGP